MPSISFPQSSEIGRAGRWDAEVFTPNLRSLDAVLQNEPKMASLCSVTHPAEIPRVYTGDATGLPFLRAQNIRPVLPEIETLVRIPRDVAGQLKTNRLKRGDVLITRSGAFSGVATTYLGDSGECYTSGEGIIVRSRGEIAGEYLAAFLSTSVGRLLCRRAIYGSGQPHIAPTYIERLPVLRLGALEDKVCELVRAAHGQLRAAAHLYPEAEGELLERLGWAEIRDRLFEAAYAVSSSDLISSERWDAEFFHPAPVQLRQRMQRLGAKKIGEFCAEPNRGVQPEFVDNGDVLVIDSKAVRQYGVEPGSERVSKAFYSSDFAAKARLRIGDVLLNSTGRGTIGRAAHYQIPQNAICDNHVAILRPEAAVCDPSYLVLFLNSPVGLMQSLQFQTGSSGQVEIYPSQIKMFEIFLPKERSGAIDLEWQKSLGKKIESARLARESAASKVADALVLIEQAMIPLTPFLSIESRQGHGAGGAFSKDDLAQVRSKAKDASTPIAPIS